ncbi:MAG: glycine zipper 2TM domain-containing protein [Alphaproteobacteria bacterium]|nr:glycine zipper 2TM domain-containing protein [Alphaproteobacteria bacterium]
MNHRTIAIVTAVALTLGGCAADSGPRETSGAVIGGVAGGLLGNTIGHGNGRAAATIIGAALGAVVGAEIGRSLDERDREYAYLAADRGLRSNRVEYWKNPQSGHRGEFRPRRSFERDGGMCRDFEHTIWVRGEPELIEGTACEMADGSWRVVS